MEFGRKAEFSGGNVVQVISETPGSGGGANWISGSVDHAVWATEDDYTVWNGNVSVENYSDPSFDGKPSQSWSGSEPPNKKSRNSQTADSQATNRSKAIGKMFFKTKLCCKFRAGTCPYTTNCNFAHSIEELRRPPANWHEIVATHEEEQKMLEPREEFQIPSIDSSGFGGENARFFKGRRCKKFYTDEGCPYGENCTFLHDEQSRVRESVAISLNPGTGAGFGVAEEFGSNVKPPTWKTRICNKWEMTGYCPFGNKCHFAHGAAELHQYGGGLVETESEHSSVPPNSKQGVVHSKPSADVVVASGTSVPHSDFYRIGVMSQRTSSGVIQRPGQNTLPKWKGPDKISRIYGDWIDDIE